MDLKTIIAIWHVAEKGKTETVRAIANNLMEMYPNYNAIFPNPAFVPDENDFRLVIEINGKIIGIESEGDPNSNLETRLIELATKYKCDIIYCTTRTKGETVRAVERTADSHDFDQIWTSTYQTTAQHQIVNDLKAKHIIDLTQNLNLL